MREFTYQIKDQEGIHARPAGQLVKLAKGFASDVTIRRGERSVSAKKLFALMGMGIKQDEVVTVTVSGADEEAALTALETFFREQL